MDETKENKFVIEHYQKTSWNLTSPLQTIARHAGLDKIVRPYDNMRMSRSNEVRKRWGQVLESLWIGHSEKVMKDHYALVSDEEFAEAAGVAKADLESQVSHVHAHAEPTVKDGLGRIVPLDEQVDLMPCFLACIGFLRVKRHAKKTAVTPSGESHVNGTGRVKALRVIILT